MKIGVLLDEPEIIPGFDYTFYEVKLSSGRIHQPLPKAWNVVNCFADNTITQTKPELVATSKGERAVRGTPKHFLWDWICPSRAEYRDYCLKVIQDVARHEIDGIRLDSVCFPRENYCDCPNCTDLSRESEMDFIEWRSSQIESFIRTVRESITCSLGLTLEPDPCYGKERFGLDLEKISEYVDFLSTPLYMDYSIVYWLDIIANCFRRRISKPYFIELYAGHPRAPTKNLVSALAVASGFADCVVLSTYEAKIAKDLQREMVRNKEVTRFFEERECAAMLEVLNRWREIL
ncbi:MAG: putative glycoside hydrolase [Candidatus Bathyarchaeia archaeon]